MDDRPSNAERAKASLAAALRVARAEDAERSEVIADLRTLAIARLQVLRDALEPILAQIPADIDLFDVGLMPGDPPRLFVDMIAFVELTRDRRRYRFLQDRRHGRILLAEVETLDDAVEAVTAYIARRIVERDKALAATDALLPASSPVKSGVRRGRLADPTAAARPSWAAVLARSWSASWPPERSGRAGWYLAGQVFWFVVEVLGLLSLFGLLVFGVRALVFLAAALGGQG